MSILKDMLSYWVQGKEVFVGDHVSIESPNVIEAVEEIQQAELTSSTSNDCVSSQTQALPSLPSTSNSCSTFVDDPNCIPGRKLEILRIQYGHAAAAEISFWTR